MAKRPRGYHNKTKMETTQRSSSLLPFDLLCCSTVLNLHGRVNRCSNTIFLRLFVTFLSDQLSFSRLHRVNVRSEVHR